MLIRYSPLSLINGKSIQINKKPPPIISIFIGGVFCLDTLILGLSKDCD
jgi:hypothetical protein